MKTIIAKTMELKGTNYEIGYSLGKLTALSPALMVLHTSGCSGFGKKETEQAIHLFSKWCPGLPEELNGFADALKVAPEKIVYYAMTYLRPNCSQLALLPAKTENGHPLIARSYEFNDEAEDFMLLKTSVSGKYTHIGTSVLSFGRDDGFNDQGLCVTMSSNGFPVGANENMRRPAVRGLQFFAVIRSVLENCKDVEKAITFIKEMPFAYNLNMILADQHGNAALVETLDGRIAFKRIYSGSNEHYLYATNHPLLESIIPFEPQAMSNSLKRCQTIQSFADRHEKISIDQLKTLLLTHYPEGLCCHYYKDFFGTTKSMIIDPLEGTIDLCWGGRKENGWHRYCISDSFPENFHEIQLENDSADPALFQMQPLTLAKE